MFITLDANTAALNLSAFGWSSVWKTKDYFKQTQGDVCLTRPQFSWLKLIKPRVTF